MSDYPRHHHSGSSYPPRGEGGRCDPDDPDPADQPRDPGGECGKLPCDEPPVLNPPEPCPEPRCNCPKPPSSTSNCLQELIDHQQKEINEAARAQAFKADLDALLAKAKAATLDYTNDKYDKLVAQWVKEDCDIAELIRKLVCAVPCWWCLIECFICPLLYEIRMREKQLYGDGTLYPTVNSLYDLRYWHDRDRYKKKAVLDRVKAVLAAWEKPAQTIDKVLADNATLILNSTKILGPDQTKLVYDVFLTLVPRHLAIAPPASSGYVTKIAKVYTEFCECDEGHPDDCCGPDVGRLSVRERLIGPLPYLIRPCDFYEVICCLTKKRYLPAKDAWSAAESAFEGVDAQIKRITGEITDKLSSLEKNAKAALPADCDWLEPPRNTAS